MDKMQKEGFEQNMKMKKKLHQHPIYHTDRRNQIRADPLAGFLYEVEITTQ